MLTEDSKNTIIRSLIKDERKRQRKSASAIANLSGISQQYLSEIERGKKLPTWSTLLDLFDILDIQFCEEISLYKEAVSTLNHITDAFLNFDQAALNQYTTELCSLKYRNSYAYFYYKLGLIIRRTLIERKSFNYHSVPEFPERKLQLFCILCEEKAENMMIDTYSQESLQNNITIFSYSTEDIYENGICSVLLSDLATLYEKENSFFDALKIYEKAQKIASENYYVTFGLSIELQIASLYSKMGQTATSTLLNQKLIEKAHGAKHRRIRNAAVFNVAANQMISGKYKECIETATDFLARESPSTYSASYYLLAFSYYMLGNESEALDNCLKVLDSETCPDICKDFARNIQLIIQGQANKNNLLALFHNCIENGDRSDVAVSFNFLKKYLVSIEDYQTAYNCCFEYLSLLLS